MHIRTQMSAASLFCNAHRTVALLPAAWISFWCCCLTMQNAELLLFFTIFCFVYLLFQFNSLCRSCFFGIWFHIGNIFLNDSLLMITFSMEFFLYEQINYNCIIDLIFDLDVRDWSKVAILTAYFPFTVDKIVVYIFVLWNNVVNCQWTP